MNQKIGFFIFAAMLLALLAGKSTAATVGGHVVVKGGIFRSIYGATYNGAMSGDVYIEMYGGSLTNSILFGTLSGGSSTANVYITVGGGTVPSFATGSKFTGTKSITLTGGTVNTLGYDATVDLTNGGAVTVKAESEGVTVTTKTAEGYTVLHEGTKYTVPFVYVDGTGATPGAYADFKAAVTALPEAGGTIVVCGTVAVDKATTLASGGALLIISKYGDEDYTDVAAIAVGNDITLGCDVTFKDVTLDKAKTGDNYIVANGYALTIDEGVYCRHILSTRYISIIGGAKSGTLTGNTNVTVKSGYFRNIFGGNYNGTFKGTSTVNFLGGYVDNMVTGSTQATQLRQRSARQRTLPLQAVRISSL